MAKYANTIVRKKNSISGSNAAEGIPIFIKSGEDLINIFSDEEMTIQKQNPFMTDENGFFEFYAPKGKYNMQIGSPAIKNVEIELFDYGVLFPGANVLSNAPLGNKFLQRAISLELIEDYPDLAGTPGYPLDVTPSGIQFDSNYLSTEEISSTNTVYKQVKLDSNGRIYIMGTSKSGYTGSFCYSDDDGATELYPFSSNNVNKLCVAFNSQYILTGGLSGNISIFGFASTAYLGNKLAGTLDINFLDYDTQTGTWIAANRSGSVYRTTDPLVGWTLDGSINGVTGSLNYYEKTSNGYIIFNDSDNTLSFVSTLLGSPTASIVIPSTGSNIMFAKCSNLSSGKILVATQAGSGRMFFRSSDGGQSFTEIFPTNPNANNAADLIHIGNDVWVIQMAFSASIYYTLDFGDTWVNVPYTKPATAGNGNRLYSNQLGDVIATFTGDLTARTLFKSLTIPPTEFSVSELTSPSATDLYYVKATKD